jgi:hypothetical protein
MWTRAAKAASDAAKAIDDVFSEDGLAVDDQEVVPISERLMGGL